MEEKNLQLERLVFFSDAVVAIAITLLALDIKIEHTKTGHIEFADIWQQGKTFAAFLLSFFNIASFWKTHHSFFVYIKKIDEKLLWYNIAWLLFIVLVPFTTSMISNYFFDVAPMVFYSANAFMIAVFQNLIWDYSSDHQLLDPNKDSVAMDTRVRAFCNLDMFNSLLGILVSFFNPLVAFILLFTKLPMILFARLYYRKNKSLQA